MPQHRRYTKREKLSAVLAADMVGVTVAAEQSGIPKSSIAYWMDNPEFAEIRTKTREDMAEEIAVVAHLAWKRIAQSLASGEMEPRDAIFAAEKATNLQLLMSGEATERTETRSLTDGLDDHEAEVLGQVIRDELARRADEEAPEVAVENPAATGAETT
jgi:hypothetical protein